MKHLHIVCRYRSKSMERMVAPLLADNSLPKFYRVTVSEEPDPQADINYHVPWHSLVNLEMGTSKHVMLYTHVNPTDKTALADACQRADKIICMSFTGRSELVSMGIDPAKLWVVYPGSNDFHFRRRIIGVVGFEQPNGRKRSHILLDLAWLMSDKDKQVMQIVLIGADWQPLADKLNNTGLATIVKEMIDDDQLNAIYGEMDCLLVTGYAEGGPLPFLEAWSSGVKVFSPAVGFAGDFLDAASTYISVEDLISKLHGWIHEPLTNAYLAHSLDWTQYAAETALIIGSLFGDSAEITDGCDRYAQLLPIIAACHAKTIVEIGTWNGGRAVQMIQAAAAQWPIETIRYIGFDLFEQQTGADYRVEGSKQGWPIDIVSKRLAATRAKIDLRSGYTSQTLSSQDGTLKADFYFIDGGHSQATIEHDWNNVSNLMGQSSVVVFDDFYYGEHPDGLGCNQVINRLDDRWDVEYMPVVTATNGLKIGMVKVKYADLRLYGRDPFAGSAACYDIESRDCLPGVRIDDAPQTASDSGQLGWIAPTLIPHAQPSRAGHD